jgi:hypothetical protein
VLYQGSTAVAAIESKQVFELTLPKYFPTIAQDREKLLSFKGSHPKAKLFQVVFFGALPSAWYPAGRWRGEVFLCRNEYIRNLTLSDQYEQVRQHIGVRAAWPQSPPMLHRLDCRRVNARKLEKWAHCSAFTYDDAMWRFDTQPYFKDAEVGAAMWEH